MACKDPTQIHHPVQIKLILFAILACVSQVRSQQQAPVGRSKILIPDLPRDHYQFWFKNHPLAFQEFDRICSQTPSIFQPGRGSATADNLKFFQALHSNLTFENSRYLTQLSYGRSLLNHICSKFENVAKSCWGYENNCQMIYLMPECLGSHLGQAKDQQDQKIKWFSQADFGYILDRRRELSRFCAPDRRSNESVKSSLECTKFFRTCRGENLMMRFKDIPRDGSLITHDKQDLFQKGDIGGWNCDLQQKRILEENGQRGALQSWFNELENYNLLAGDGLEKSCDINIDKQVFLVKLDSTSNMYHYFCNFLNLYATIHMNNKFSEDNQIVIWDNQKPMGPFQRMWSVFTKNPLKNIGDFDGKRVCFKKFIFTLLPRMVDGLYYNTVLVPGCRKSGLFDAFNKHVLHRLGIVQRYDSKYHKAAENAIIRVTIISRSTPHRRILNEQELVNKLKMESHDYHVRVVDYADLDFLKQLEITHNTDILVGVHGAGLSHTLFLPDWAALLEVHSCGDKCYYDLARLRGISYFSSTKEQKLAVRVPVDDQGEFQRLNASNLLSNDKFNNYRVDENEFIRIVKEAADRIRKDRAKYFNDPMRKADIPNDTLTQAKVQRVGAGKAQTDSGHTEL